MKISSTRYLKDEKCKLEVDEKVWGTELIISRSPHASKIMVVKPGYQVSMHWHAIKSETFILVSGKLIVELLDKAGYLSVVELDKPFSSITLPHRTPHTFYCPDDQKGDTVFIECSTADSKDDSYRIFPSGKRSKDANPR